MLPVNGFASGGDSIVTEPIFDPAGHALSYVRSPFLNCASVHSWRPTDPDGFSPIPSGSDTTALRSCDSWIALSAPVKYFSVVSTFAGEGESTDPVPASTLMAGLKGTFAHPVCWMK